MRRREFIAGLGSATAWPVVARAQQPPMPVIGYLHPSLPEHYAYQVAAFRKGLSEMGFVEGRNLAIEFRWAQDQLDRLPEFAAELVRRRVDLIAAPGSPAAALAAKAATATIPIVFTVSVDPVESGLVASLSRPSWARPGGNTTGFTLFEFSVLSKMLETLKQIAPRITRLAVIFHAENPESTISLRLLETAAPSFAVKLIPAPVRDRAEIERAIETLAHEPDTGLLLLPDIFTSVHRELIVALAARHRVPAVGSTRSYPADGGLVSYGVDVIDIYRRAAGYVDRILRGEKPADLPVQAPTKFELVINRKTAKALSLEISPTLLALADEVIE
jgi:putative ABC transport system substrate-binding protein